MGGGCSADGGLPDIFIDLANASSSDSNENSTVSGIQSRVLSSAPDILRRYSGYQDCQQLISVAISNASPANVDAAWAAAVPNVQFQSELFDFANSLISAFQSLVTYVLSAGAGRALQAFEEHPLVAKTFGDFFNAIVSFDETTVKLPRLLGDLSFFRRTASRRPDFQDYDELYQKSSEMSMFFAVPNPLLTKAINAVQGTARNPQEVARVIDVFGGLCDAFTSTQMHHHFSDEELNLISYRTIAGSILFYDSISASGAFHAKAGLKTVTAVEVLAGAQPKQTGLLNLLKFNSKHYKDPTTQKQITALIN
jgi:hypothetical protein